MHVLVVLLIVILMFVQLSSNINKSSSLGSNHFSPSAVRWVQTDIQPGRNLSPLFQMDFLFATVLDDFGQVGCDSTFCALVVSCMSALSPWIKIAFLKAMQGQQEFGHRGEGSQGLHKARVSLWSSQSTGTKAFEQTQEDTRSFSEREPPCSIGTWGYVDPKPRNKPRFWC